MARPLFRRYPTNMEDYFTLDELAAYLGVKSTGSLRVQIARGALKAERVGKRTLIVRKEEAKRYKDENRAGEGKPGRRSVPPPAPPPEGSH